MPDTHSTIRMPIWRDSRRRRLLARLGRPVVWLLNRPAAAGFGRALYDLALRCNGIGINFAGRHGLTAAEEAFLARHAARLQGGVLLDVGANAGHYAAHLRRLAPEARILAFEPHPRTYQALCAALQGSGIETLQLALNEDGGSLELHDFAAGDGSTQASLSREAVGFYSAATVSHHVDCARLDDVLDQQGIQRVALLKVDTEGFDLSVLRGAARAIADRRIDIIQFEFIPANIATRVTMRDLYAALPGYAIHRLCLNGDLLPLGDYDVKWCEIYVTQNLVALPA
ncbi:FkbM family methyltransferase [Falsiroseomonas tokyonensis]|uniref:FkbM family methyltransferase n=1 Tax=Falsiroseomonas tokyonensis TaxID=430521 RepID=A0ABV7BQ16_9PROT|nr:FkbM family methyltransferase [Falsiroseomonas tokyonensis]MBU8536744.1 FkbM family methyltransferase [Falsiroseomonas tokyonensis]